MYFSWYRVPLLRVFLANYQLTSALCNLWHSPEMSDEPGQAANTLSHPRPFSWDLHLLLTLDGPRGGEDIQSFHFVNVGVGNWHDFRLIGWKFQTLLNFQHLYQLKFSPRNLRTSLACNYNASPESICPSLRSLRYLTQDKIHNGTLCSHYEVYYTTIGDTPQMVWPATNYTLCTGKTKVRV